MIVAGDIGGTNTRLAFFTGEENRLISVIEETFPSRAHSGLAEIVQQFLSAHKLSPTIACFGIAGPVKNGRSETTNLPWIVDARLLASELRIPTVLLVNDLEATAYGATILAPTEWTVLNAGAPDAVGNAAVIAAGTGLGEAGLYWDGRFYRPFATEGGHADFAPRTAVEIELLRFLLAQFERVSYERVLSGPGLVNIYQFLRETGRDKEPAWLTEELRFHAAIPGRAGTGGRRTEKKDRARPEASDQPRFPGRKTRTRRDTEQRHRFGASGRRGAAQTDERLGPREERGTLAVRIIGKPRYGLASESSR